MNIPVIPHFTTLKFYYLLLCLLFLKNGLIVAEDVVISSNHGIKIKAVGDIVPGTDFPDKSRLPARGGEQLFEQVSTYLNDTDLLFGNYESTFTDYPKTRKNTSRKMVFAFRTPPAFAADLKKAGFDILNIANNHSNDFYEKGFQDTAKNIKAADMLFTGFKNEINTTEKNGLRIAFIGFSYLDFHNSILDYSHTANIIKKAVQQADIVIVSVHGGAEGVSAVHIENKNENFYGENRGNLVKFSHLAIDSGADLVLGHGPHVPRAMELYKERLIAYSLGNFIGYHVFSINSYTSYSLILEVNLDKTGKFETGKIIPLILSSEGIPHYDAEGRSIKLIKNLMDNDIKNKNLILNNEGILQYSR